MEIHANGFKMVWIIKIFEAALTAPQAPTQQNKRHSAYFPYYEVIKIWPLHWSPCKFNINTLFHLHLTLIEVEQQGVFAQDWTPSSKRSF